RDSLRHDGARRLLVPHGHRFHRRHGRVLRRDLRPPVNAVEDQTDRIRMKYEKFAKTYDRQIRFFERALFRGGREWVCSRAGGETLEIAIGTGRNLPFYPPEVTLT